MLGFRPFTPADAPACLAICQAGVPKYFSPADVADFRSFLAAPVGRFVVGELAGAVRACGGYHVRDDGTAGLGWGMVHPDDHRRGLGGELLRYRIARIREVRHA